MTTDGRIFITDGIWNNVSYHVPWIRQKAMELHEDLDNCGSGGGGGGTGITDDFYDWLAVMKYIIHI